MTWPLHAWVYLAVGPLFSGALLLYGWRHWYALTAPLRIFLGLAGLSIMLEAIQLGTALGGHNNLWVSHAWWWAFTALTLLALAHWVPPGWGRRLRLMALLWSALWVVLYAAGLESLAGQMALSNPAHALVLLLATFTVVAHRAWHHLDMPLARQPWFLACIGLLLYATLASLRGPILQAVVDSDPVRARLILWVGRVGYLAYVTSMLLSFRAEVAARGVTPGGLVPAAAGSPG